VAKLPIDYTQWNHYEVAALHSGPRMMHREFCIISDRPEVLLVDDMNRPHNEDGPFCRWRDGVALYAVDGVYVPQWVVEQKEQITAADISAEQNAEVRRIMIRFYGEGRYLLETKARVIDADNSPTGIPRCLLLDGLSGIKWLVGTDGSTERSYYMPVPDEVATCREAHNAIACANEEHIVLES
jgi:hypothetical protein